MANGNRPDPLISAQFAVEFQGVIVGAFQECTGMGSENDVVEYKASGQKGDFVIHKIPGRMKWNNITLKRGITDALDLWDWRKLVEEGKIEEARKNGSIIMFDQTGKEVARWEFINAWPCKLSGPSPNAGENAAAIEELEITHEGYKRTK